MTMATWKSLAVGALPPNAVMSVHLDRPLDLDADFPAVITVTGANSVSVIKTEPTQITLRNNTHTLTPYWLVVVPRQAVAAVTTDWARLIQAIRQRLLKGKNR